jgi:hypothetical protein
LGGLAYRALYWVLDEQLDAHFMSGLIDGFKGGWDGDKATVIMIAQAAVSPIETAKAIGGFLKECTTAISNGGITRILDTLRQGLRNLSLPTVGQTAYYTGVLIGFLFEQLLVTVAIIAATKGMAALVVVVGKYLQGIAWMASLAVKVQKFLKSLAYALNGLKNVTTDSKAARATITWLKEAGTVVDDIWTKYPKPKRSWKRPASLPMSARKLQNERCIG